MALRKSEILSDGSEESLEISMAAREELKFMIALRELAHLYTIPSPPPLLRLNLTSTIAPSSTCIGAFLLFPD